MRRERAAWRFTKLPHAQRVALREVMLRGAARSYAQDVNSPDEESAAAGLREAAIEYATTLLQRAGADERTARASHHPNDKSPDTPEAK